MRNQKHSNNHKIVSGIASMARCYVLHSPQQACRGKKLVFTIEQ
jgi:hypothetical protein